MNETLKSEIREMYYGSDFNFESKKLKHVYFVIFLMRLKKLSFKNAKILLKEVIIEKEEKASNYETTINSQCVRDLVDGIPGDIEFESLVNNGKIMELILEQKKLSKGDLEKFNTIFNPEESVEEKKNKEQHNKEIQELPSSLEGNSRVQRRTPGHIQQARRT